GDKATVSGTVGTRGLHLCYYQRASDKLQLGVELETDLHIKESVASLAYQGKCTHLRGVEKQPLEISTGTRTSAISSLV
ncbi:unnamed protein product, partial [Timema podura]|nr:unnamed protein product [Timema podura]